MLKPFIISLIFATGVFSQWSTETVDNTDDLGDYTSISTDIGNNPNITYRQVGDQIKYAHWTGIWALETITLGESGRWTADIGMDKYDIVPHITYGGNDTGTIYHYYRQSATWNQETVLTGFTADMTRMKIDADNNIHLIYTSSATPFSLKYSYGSGSGTKVWTNSDICTNVSSRSINLVMDNNKLPNIAYFGQAPKNPFYGYKTNTGIWQLAQLNADTVSSQKVAIAVDKNNLVHIAYIAAGNLKYTSGTWGSFAATVTVDSGLGGGQGYVAIATNSSNIPYIAYYNATAKSLKCANFKNSTWTAEDVDVTPGATVGEFCSIAIRSNDIPQIAYYDKTNTSLKFAKIVLPPPAAKTLDIKLVNNIFKPKSGEYMNIQYTVNDTGNVVIKIYSLSGELLKEVKNGTISAGTFIERWYGDDKNGTTAASGTYLITINYGGIKSTKKAIIIR